MKRVEAPCPACGANVEFRASSSLVTVCEYCQSVVARGDQKLEDFGKVGRIAPTNSIFSLETQGLYRNKSFEVVGHIQYEHAGGGTWNEWYALFPGDRWGWLAEAQGKIYLLFKRKLSGESTLPSLDSLSVGESLKIAGETPLTVAEIGTSTVKAGEGEMPFVVQEGKSHQYVDLAGKDGVFATLEYDEQGQGVLYLGQEVTPQDLGIAVEAAILDAEVIEIGAMQVSCPQCGGSLDLRAPDETQRVVCPFCDSMLDAQQGNLKYLETLKVSKKLAPVIPIGSTGNLWGADYTIIGYMRRSVTYDRDYFWSEYLLHNPKLGFRWLVHSDDHWSFVEPASVGDLTKYTGNKAVVNYKGKQFKRFQAAVASVRYVLGEFYWKVSLDEQVRAVDYIAPPYMLSEESACFGKAEQAGRAQETTYSLGTYLPHEELEAAFNIKGLRRGWGVAPNRPVKTDFKPVMISWAIMAAVVFGINMLASVGLSLGKPDQGWFFTALVAVSAVPVFSLLHRHSMERKRWEDSEFNPYSTD